jgi:phospho-N-acetylmuramoyl-pentapeptide-transferase
MTISGGIAGYLWWNAEPSKVLMGDAGSRFLGLLVGAGVLVTGNPFLIFVFAPVVIANGGLGLVKLIILRVLKMFKIDTRPTATLTKEEQAKQNKIVKALFAIRFPLHDHMKRNHSWSNAQVLMRFMLVQMFLVPILFLIFVKIR